MLGSEKKKQLANTVTDFITDELEPYELFDDEVLVDWAEDNLEKLDEDKLKARMREKYTPDEVFTREQLDEWAVEHGFTAV